MNLEAVVVVWFVVSVVLLVFGNLAFYAWLRAKGLPVRFMYAGTPGYLDYHYAPQWQGSCRFFRYRFLGGEEATAT